MHKNKTKLTRLNGEYIRCVDQNLEVVTDSGLWLMGDVGIHKYNKIIFYSFLSF